MLRAYALIRERPDGRWDQVDHYIGLSAVERGLRAFRGAGRHAVMEIEGRCAVIFEARIGATWPPIEELVSDLRSGSA